ncbi:DUF3108 domain-containing protein [Cytophagales bacterium LB-30]|uniref:DUF3108 domain-containing protein n=1 Tax=Shiella aurantiaca TaxID=3058365 RepID=A0ABT8F1J6_9BACT|nr:DUF3108 domain-containing protein [Shiella aurantiaca]MDN4164111.1 DUF3108 domain-containing protein [Shiella aurantiaca]
MKARIPFFFLFGLMVVLMGATQVSTENDYPVLPELRVAKGEVIEYKVNFSFIPVGKAQIRIGKNLHKVNERECYKIDIYGKTVGAIDWVAQVNDQWGGYIDTASALPHLTYRNIAEGNYRKKEITRFDHTTRMIEAKVLNNKTGEFKEPMYHQLPSWPMYDLVSGYLLLRGMDFSVYQVEDTITIPAFFEDTFYELNVLFKGREIINTKLGKINSLKLVPIMPDNQLFDGENSISVWISDDDNKLPLRVEANMFIGKAEVDILSAQGVLHEVNFKSTKKAGQTVNAPSQLETIDNEEPVEN